ncbi:hypothetical protein AB3N58_10525 [Leptospira sp. WS60.C2]
MRLNVMYELLEKYKDSIKLKNQVENNNHVLVGILDSQEALEQLKLIPALTEPINELQRKFSLRAIDTNKIAISGESTVLFKQEILLLKNKIELLSEVLDKMVTKESTFEIYIKLFEINDLEELEKLINNLRKIVFLPLTSLDGTVELTGFDVGSKYLNLLLSSAFIFHFFSGMLKEASDLYIYSFQKMVMANKLVETYNFSEEALKEFKEKTSNEYNQSLLEKAEKICNSPEISEKITNDKQNEFRNNTKFAIDELAKLMDKGLEIYHSIEAPPESRVNFPNYEKFKEVKGSQKLLSSE